MPENTLTIQEPEIITAEERRQKVRQAIMAIQGKISQMPGAIFGDNPICPLKHTFVDGAYVREMFAPKGMLIVTKIHKITHPYFILKGEVSVLTEEGVVRLKAPYSGITKAGTKRIVYVHEDTIWITVHVTNETDIAKIEEQVIAKDYKQFDEEQINKFSEHLLEAGNE
jgi:hypothetical protein